MLRNSLTLSVGGREAPLPFLGGDLDLSIDIDRALLGDLEIDLDLDLLRDIASTVDEL